MKKHLIFLVVFGIAAAVIAGLMLYCPDCNSTPPPTNPPEADVLSDSINALEGRPYNQASVDYIQTKLQAQRNLGKIDQRKYAAMINSLEISTQTSLCNSINAWAKDHCTSTNIGSVVQIAQSYAEKNENLRQALVVYSRYQNALSFSGRLQRFLSGYYNPLEADRLRSDFQGVIRGFVWRNCPKITRIEGNIKQEIKDFENFHGIYKFKVGDPNADPNSIEANKIKDRSYFSKIENKSTLLKYPKYYTDYEKRKKLPPF
jgi:hypothetical protein